MKILKEGNLKRLKRPLIFDCETCGCEFEADNTEYTWEFSQREGYGWYSIKCPTCGYFVTVDDNEVKEPTYC